MKEKKENSKEKNTILLLLLLFAIVIIVFLLLRSCGRIDHMQLIPTGNVDIFDINFGKDCDCDDFCGDSKPVFGEGSSTDGVDVYDDDVFFSTSTKLNIFTQTSYYVVDGKIAPTSENSYQFVIRNNNDFNITYSLEMFETNKYNINMKYRLKLNGVYVLGSNTEYVSASELKQYNMTLTGNKYDVYTLDWKWFESDNDTEVGMNIDSEYELDVKISASAD